MKVPKGKRQSIRNTTRVKSTKPGNTSHNRTQGQLRESPESTQKGNLAGLRQKIKIIGTNP